MNKYIKLLGSLLIAIVSITTIVFGLNIKEGSKAADFKHNLTSENNGSDFRGGRLANNVGSSFVDPFEKDSLPKIKSQSKIQSRGSGDLTPVSIGPGDSQNFFATVGSAVAKVNDDGTWDTISINEPKYYQVGAVTLNATVDMTQDFNFSWNLKIERSSVAFLADGLGFIFHPMYSPGETITDLNGGAPYVLPAVFGRHSDTTPVTTAADPDLGQNIHSIGINGGDLGISDIMNAISFKIDTNYNGIIGTRTPNTPYGSTSHRLDIDRHPDDYYAGTAAGGVSNGSFVTTDNTGFSSASQYSAPLNGLAVTPKSDAFGGVSGDSIVVPDNTWRPMQIFYTAASHTLKVTIGDAATGGQVSWTKILNANEQAIIASKPSWAFSILGSTGAGVEGNTIKNIRGTFTPGDPVITTRYIDENGNDLQPPVSTLEANWQVTHPGSTQFTDSTSPATIVKNGKTYRRSQVNGTFFDNNTRTNKRLGAPGSGSTVDTSGGNVNVTTNFGNIIFVNYVYRQELPAGSTDVTSDLQLSTDGTTFSKTANIHPGDEVTFKYTAKNNTLPIWHKVTAVQSLGGLFTPTGTLPAGVTQKAGLLYVPINVGAINDIRAGETGTNTVKMKYQGVEKASLTANDAGQITITNNPATPGAAKTSTIVSKVSIYDQSNQLIDDSGNPIYGSYFYNAANANAPLASTETVYNTANYVPTTDSVTVNDLGWWDFNETTKVLTIYPHELNASADWKPFPNPNSTSYRDWPWNPYKRQITKAVIKPGVTARNSLYGLFAFIPSLTTIEGLEGLDTSQVINMGSMFNECKLLTDLNVSNFNTSKVTDMSWMFSGCGALTNLGANNFDTSKVTNMSYMFSGCESLTSLDVINFNTSNVENMPRMFSKCKSLINLDVTHFDTSKVVSMGSMFSDCESLLSIDVTHFNTINVVDMDSMFSKCKSLTNLDVTHFDTSRVTDMSNMFEWCSSLASLDVSNFDTSNVTDMHRMFMHCGSLTSLDVTNFDTSKVTNMSDMFDWCSSLTSLDVSNFDTRNVTDMSYMFSSCMALPSINVSDFKTGNVTNMSEMFSHCYKLKTLDVSNFDTNKVTNMYRMFLRCIELTELDLSSFDLTNITTTSDGIMIVGGYDGILYAEYSLWKLKLGPNTKFPDITVDGFVSSVGLEDPTPGTKIKDLVDTSTDYFATDAQWREVGVGGSDHEPKGAVKTAAQIMSESATRNDVRTYVWDQRGRVLLEVPTAINFGTHRGSIRNHTYTSGAQTLKVTDNRNSRKNKKWQIYGETTPLTNGTKRIAGNPLFYKDSNGKKNLNSVATLLAEKNIPGVIYEDIWEQPWELLFETSSSSIPKEGRYSGTVTYTLINATP
ncbi:BspA family leucine-rich repeat surface protein [Xylocopilactobacillus apis]|uniref:Surface protein n=1 Tax=Xylocopilactobacillus apis TaxID=2932183 RepID=A0AAU9D2A0_9LACO|nr:BspA family leucine-rich repeat surface protein [Xylocopilactobacillus apis]BDR55510.1 hypothetical protein KIMC2_00720 [Xylocopilactobacillus apis]